MFVNSEMHRCLCALFILKGAVAIKLAQDDHKGKETGLHKDKQNLKVQLKEQELANEDVVKTLLRVKIRLLMVHFLLLTENIECRNWWC